MKLSEAFAVGQILSTWPENATYDEVLTSLKDDDGDTHPWQPFECYPTDFIIEQLENTRENAAALITLSGGTDV